MVLFMGVNMLTIDILKSFGADVDEGLERCLDDEVFYLELIPSALDESYYKAIDDALAAKDLDKAFEAAHALKGLLANLSLNPICEPVSEMTELLRSRTDTDYSSYSEKMWEQRNKLVEMIG